MKTLASPAQLDRNDPGGFRLCLDFDKYGTKRFFKAISLLRCNGCPQNRNVTQRGKKSGGSQRIMMKSITSSDQKENLESSVTNVLQFFCCNFL